MSIQTLSMENLDFDKVPLIGLRQTSYNILSKSLNSPKLLPNDGGIPRDWRGISDLVGIEYRSDISLSDNSIKKIIELWNLDQNYSDTASFGNLLKFLCEIDRWDVYDDLQSSLAEDAKIYFHKQKNKDLKCEVQKHYKMDNCDGSESDLTIDDVQNRRNGKPLQKYDALLIYADQDITFVRKVIQEMENRGIKLCITERDLLGGITFEHEAEMRLVSERCNRLVVIISTSFYLSPANKFIVNYAQAIGIEQGKRKIIPCIYERCKLQSPLDIYFALDYPRSVGLWNFWEKLFESIQSTSATNKQSNFFVPKISSITEVANTEDKIENLVNDNSTALSTQPIKMPRRKNLKKSLPCSTDTSNLSNSHSTINDHSSAIQAQMNENLDKCNIDTSVYNDSIPDTIIANGTIKKKIWYKKIFSGKNKLLKSEENDNIKNDNAKVKGTKNWLRKKLVIA